MLNDELHRAEVKLSEEEWIALVTWVDANPPYYETFINKRPPDGGSPRRDIRIHLPDPFAGATQFPENASLGVLCRGQRGLIRTYSTASRATDGSDGSVFRRTSPALPRTAEKIQANQPVKIICLGDSVTGIYYHTGGRRAYPEMLAVALKLWNPQADVAVINAGISGNSTVDGLQRLQKDVLDHKPDLVTVMFGLNDMVRVPIPDFQANLGRIIEQCRMRGAEVLLATPNSVIDTPDRPAAKLVEYCGAIRAVAQRYQTPVCDIYAAYEALRCRDSLSWRFLLSDEIHPNMDGHKLSAATLCQMITGQDVSLKSTGPPQPAMPKTQTLLQAGKPVRVLAMAPYDKLVGPALRSQLAPLRSK